MKIEGLYRCRAFVAVGLLAAIGLAQAQQGDAGTDTPLTQGAYIAPMGSFLLTPGNKQVGDGYGGILGFGYRQDFFAIEGRAFYTSFSASGNNGNMRREGGGIDGLLFPFSLKSMPQPFATDSLGSRLTSNVYLIAGVAGAQSKDYPAADSKESFGLLSLSGGVGDLIPVKLFGYSFAVRGEALYETDHREQKIGPSSGTSAQFMDQSAPRNTREWVFNIGLQLPLTWTHEAPSPPPEPAKVVPVVAPLDTDGDGVPDDRDQCPGTPAGVQVDANGCP